jgi:biopolymer transport protein ExbD
MHTITKRRTDVSINASSMADIAFLLLVFFLVTTTIDVEKGIKVLLPPIQDEPPIDFHERNIFGVKINFNDELMVRGSITKIEELKDKAKEFIMNPLKDPTLSIAPNQAVISLQNDRSTSYNIYLSVYNELKAAYRELWEETALEIYGQHFDELSRNQRKAVQNKIPLVISEGEVVDLK